MKTTKWRDIKRPGNPHMVRGYRTARLASANLGDLREQSGVTQAALGEQLGVSQSWIAQIEAETDMRLSTIAAYVAALGGTLTLCATMPDGRHVRLDDDGTENPFALQLRNAAGGGSNEPLFFNQIVMQAAEDLLHMDADVVASRLREVFSLRLPCGTPSHDLLPALDPPPQRD